MSGTVLILFADALAAPEVAWSLHDAGLVVIAAARRGVPAAISHSRHVSLVEVTDPTVSVERSLADLRSLLRDGDALTVMPLDDLAVWMIHQLAIELPCRVCGPRGLGAAVTLDKRRQFAAARKAGFDVPSTLEIETGPDLDAISSFPSIVKPALAARVVGDVLGRGRAVFLADREAARRASVSWTAREPMLAQDHLSGVGEGLFGLALENGVVAWSAHRRVRMMNPSGSGSSACTSREPDAEVCAIAERFVQSLHWRGMFMIEFLRDRDGRLWFMELNGRPWGSMALARKLGFEYPAWAVAAMSTPHLSPRLHPPRGALVCRHLAREFIHLMFVVRGPRNDAPHEQWPRLRSTLRDLSKVGSTQAVYNWRRDDPLVLLADTYYTLRAQLRKKAAAGSPLPTRTKRLRRRIGEFVERRRQKRLRTLGLPTAVLEQADNILFVCYGNINRSALAERYLTQLIDATLTIRSGGFHRDADRPADPQMVAVAGAHGIRLDRWSSRTLDNLLVESADIIFAMEAKHLARLHLEYPQSKGRAFLLSCVTPATTGPLEIRDPFGGSRSDYERCLGEVTDAVSLLAGLIAPRHRTTGR